jgi:hypothetical protein
MAQTKDITPAVLGALEADRSLPLTRGGIARVIKNDGGGSVNQEQLKRALQGLVDSKAVVEMLGDKIPWAFEGKRSDLPYYVLTEVYNAHHDELADLAKQTADVELRRRYQDEWDELYTHALRYQKWRKS